MNRHQTEQQKKWDINATSAWLHHRQCILTECIQKSFNTKLKLWWRSSQEVKCIQKLNETVVLCQAGLNGKSSRKFKWNERQAKIVATKKCAKGGQENTSAIIHNLKRIILGRRGKFIGCRCSQKSKLTFYGCSLKLASIYKLAKGKMISSTKIKLHFF